jgi:hypothetical protein
MSLTVNLQLLARLREEADGLSVVVAAAEEELDQTPQACALAEAKDALNAKKVEIRAVEEEVRKFAIGAYEESGEKRPAPGVQVKVYSRIRYEVDRAMDWCKEYAPTFIRETLDTKSFEKVAPNLVGAPVTVEEEPRATIATDLSGWLEGRVAATR